MLLSYNTVPDIIPAFDEIFEISPDGAGILTIQVHQIEVVGVVNRLEQCPSMAR